MLNGFVGGAAKQWLSRAEAVLNAAIGVHNRNAHGVSITNERELPYTPDQALSGGGGGGSENIVADRDIYWQAMQYATDANLANGESIYQALMYVQQICSTDFLLPATTPVVQETAAQLMTALNNINNLRHEYVGIVRSIPGALAEDPTGHQVDMAWNASAANGIWREIEQTLNAQAPHMQDTITAHNREIGRMINALSQLAATANTASCPDTRAAAQRQMNEYQRRISTLQTAIMNLQRGIDDLQTGTSTLRRQLGTTQETLQETDRQLAERIR
ncbi:MAG: hypothetical protein FWC71_07175, partial [Defluviitaleaceae bacterium]|nr:hypothetical protein [Defluviitaleaceae bacterium]